MHAEGRHACGLRARHGEPALRNCVRLLDVPLGTGAALCLDQPGGVPWPRTLARSSRAGLSRRHRGARSIAVEVLDTWVAGTRAEPRPQ